MTRILSVLWILMSLTCSGGCFSKVVRVHVFDAESEEPLAGAEVTASYGASFFPDLPPPSPPLAHTDAQGHAALRVREWRRAAMIRATVPGYLPYVDQTQLGTLQEIRDALARENAAKVPPDQVELGLYREPLPTVRIVIPDGYRGPIQIHWNRTAGYHQPSGVREFIYHFSPGQVIEMTLAPPMQFVRYTDYDAAYASGTMIEAADNLRLRYGSTRWKPPPAEAVAWRFAGVTYDFSAKTHDGVVYVVGTAGDAKATGAAIGAALSGGKRYFCE
jgi:hypothetical protein